MNPEVRIPSVYVAELDQFRSRLGADRSFSVAHEGDELVMRVYDEHDQVAGEKRLPLLLDIQLPERPE